MDNKLKIINTALRLFTQDGFHGTTTASIAKEAGISNGTLFHYFKTKEELINYLYLFSKSEFRNSLCENYSESFANKSTFKKLWYSCIEWYLQNKEKVCFLSMYSNSPYIDALSKEEASRNFDFLLELIDKGIEEEILINAPKELILNTFYASILAIYKFVNNQSSDIDKNINIAFNMWWKSVVNI